MFTSLAGNETAISSTWNKHHTTELCLSPLFPTISLFKCVSISNDLDNPDEDSAVKSVATSQVTG